MVRLVVLCAVLWWVSKDSIFLNVFRQAGHSTAQFSACTVRMWRFKLDLWISFRQIVHSVRLPETQGQRLSDSCRQLTFFYEIFALNCIKRSVHRVQNLVLVVQNLLNLCIIYVLIYILNYVKYSKFDNTGDN